MIIIGIIWNRSEFIQEEVVEVCEIIVWSEFEIIVWLESHG